MGDVIRLADRIYKWREVFVREDAGTTLQVFVNEGTGELEIVQVNSDGEAIRTCLSTVDSIAMSESLTRAHQKIAR